MSGWTAASAVFGLTGWVWWLRAAPSLRAGMMTVLCWACVGLPSKAWAQADAVPDGLSLSNTDQFQLEVQAPPPLDVLLQRHLELRRFQRLPDLARSELERLAEQAPENVRNLLGTQGYFAPTVNVTLLDATATDATPTVRLMVEPGPRTRIGSVTLLLQGEARTRPDADQQRIALEKDWGLPRGEPFSQSDWSSAKSRALRGFTTHHFPRARIATSLADIDAQAHLAHLYLEIDTGAAHAFGSLEVQGALRYDPALAQRLVRLAGVRTGEPYDETLLQAAQQKLVDSGYYASAFVVLGDTTDPSASPVEIRVREVPLQKVTAGVGMSTDNGARLSLEHTHHRLPGLDWRGVTRLQLERDAQTVATELSSPVDERGWRWITGAQWQRQQDDPLTTQSQQLRLGQAQDGTELDRSFFVQYDRSQVNNTVLRLANEAESSVSANYAWTRRRFNDLTLPTNGYGLAVELGVGVTLTQQRRPYLRARGRWQSYWPLAAESARPSRVALRVEGGAVWSRDQSPVPATQRFLAGGDNSVRGYSLREIGVPQQGGGVEAGRLLAVTSLEWQRPLWLAGQRSNWETAVFIDAGAVADRASELDPKVGVGAGVRYRSPVGPLQADLAYGLETRRWRFHLSVGFTF